LEKLNERQRKVIEHLKVHKRISRSEYVKLTDCSERTAFRDLEELTKSKVVIREGKGKKLTMSWRKMARKWHERLVGV